MPPRVTEVTAGALGGKVGAFAADRYPFALPVVMNALRATGGDPPESTDPEAIERWRTAFRAVLAQELIVAHESLAGLADPVPGARPTERLAQAREELLDALDGVFAREAIAASLRADEKVELLRGMILTRATDNRLKAFFTNGEVRYRDTGFQGKGFRSLGQEAIYAAALRLRRGEEWRGPGGEWRGDVVAPVIRDLGVALAMRPGEEAVRLALAAQMGKADGPMHGRDLHIGDPEWGVLPPAAPLAVSTATLAGFACAFARDGSGRVAVSFIGEGGSSLGEWHEAINACAARRWPAIFCVQTNQTALSTPVAEQSAVRTFADKAAGYGIPGVTLDGTDPEAIAAGFGWAAARARAGLGPTLIELVAMRMCGHAHHDDMLYLGREAPPAWAYPTPAAGGYVDAERYAFWAARDPIACYAARLQQLGVIAAGDLEAWQAEATDLVERAARLVIDAPWPEPGSASAGVFHDDTPRAHVEVLDPEIRDRAASDTALPPLEPMTPFDRKGQTFLEAITLGVRDALESDPRVFVYGQDVGGKYGNAFLLLRPLLEQFGDRVLNSPLAEGAIVGVCVGAALAGLRPIGEMQFNDFVPGAFNQLVNNAAKIRWRWGGGVPMVLRMPWGGLRHAGPYHSQNTEAWFYRTPGLKIVVPSTPEDARRLLGAAIADPDPVLYYEHIALYRDPRVKQSLRQGAPEALPIGRAALRRAGDDVAIVSYGAYVHVAMRVAERLAGNGVEAAVLDLRSLAPLDKAAVLAVARHCSRVLIVHEDTRTGGLGESLAAIIQEEAFEWLDAPVRVFGALDTPVPYSPPLEEHFLPQEDQIARAARLLVEY